MKKSVENYVLEACVDSVESALEAVYGGAKRLELCDNLIIGGTTPSPFLFKEIRKQTDICIHVLIRPRFGDFYYSEYEFNRMIEEVKLFRSLGAQGIVIGMLDREGNLDQLRMKKLIETAKGCSITLHRAFDVCQDPYKTLEVAKKMGIHTILTSGQKNHCIEGKDLIRDLVRLSQGEIEILVGGGVNAQVIEELYAYTAATAYHMSGKVIKDSAMIYRKTGINMGLQFFSEYESWRTSSILITEAKKVLESLN